MMPGDYISYWVYMSDNYCATGITANCALVFGKVISIGKERVTIETEFGRRTWKYISQVSLAPEGAEYFENRSVTR